MFPDDGEREHSKLIWDSLQGTEETEGLMVQMQSYLSSRIKDTIPLGTKIDYMARSENVSLLDGY